MFPFNQGEYCEHLKQDNKRFYIFIFSNWVVKGDKFTFDFTLIFLSRIKDHR